ncbi:hypothetical protein BDF20DRAFT_579084 [Mycotypha africana]|uniref:uncharacterized protein n=1 Tax=Mycotypha africana TaxID=64632 RepID=UPI00230193B3|nr:uncharacterized protein BDF20DRAFT_579084 [Mycotypha africana]KAI8977639.1 hypothetical protein BDF20DRAFT_579084 [Mycotypha africana]
MNKQYALSRYNSIISNVIFGDDGKRLTSELTTWKHTEEYKTFWIDIINKKTQLVVHKGCTQYVSDRAQDALRMWYFYNTSFIIYKHELDKTSNTKHVIMIIES